WRNCWPSGGLPSATRPCAAGARSSGSASPTGCGTGSLCRHRV
ncbi:MAG: hypothetical protein AVDCRST_MAG77-2426, partial [uncultured Chloroflexi bacterium]